MFHNKQSEGYNNELNISIKIIKECCIPRRVAVTEVFRTYSIPALLPYNILGNIPVILLQL